MLFSSVFFIGVINAQTVPNGNFEAWTGSAPTGWTYDNQAIFQSTDKHSGNYAVKLLIPSDGYNPSIETQGATDNFVTVPNPKVPPANYVCWYKLYQVNGESFRVSFNAKDGSGNNGAVGVAYTATGSSTTYTQLTIPVTNPLNRSINTIDLTCDFLGNGQKAGTYVIIDDIAPTSTTGFEELKQVNNIEQVYPNPARDRSEIIYSIKENTHIKLFVTDVTGRMVSVLVDENQVSGRYKAIVTDLPQGTYFCTIQTDAGVQTQKLIITE